MIRRLQEAEYNNQYEQLLSQVSQIGLPVGESIAADICGTVLGTPLSTSPHSKGGLYNRIPSDHHGPCTDVLLIFCLGKGFENRLKDALHHATEACPDTKQIYFVTNQWGPTVWARYEKKFHALHANMSVFFYAVGHFSLLT